VPLIIDFVERGQRGGGETRSRSKDRAQGGAHAQAGSR